ncbi:acyl-CoA carboxylase subunit beta [SAR86 cluster bacterium]|nr:acyl-CoA carboxylase subunit beta [SAR86 cluster bacterium]
MYKLESQPFISKLQTGTDDFKKNKSSMLGMLDEIDTLLDEAEAGGGPDHHKRLAARGKLPVRERIFHFLDSDSPFLEISSLAGYKSDYPVGGGAVAGVGVSAGVECIVFANDPTVLAGAMHFYSVKKWMRAMQIARDCRIPFIQFVESAGGDLRPRGGMSSAVGTTHFAESGRQFYEITELSKLNIPTVTVVFGTATAGGAYQPGMSDYNIFVKDQADVALGGPPLVMMATGEVSSREDIGGAKMHAEKSGLAEYLADDDLDGVRIAREVMSHLNWDKEGKLPRFQIKPPLYKQADLLGLIEPSLKTPFDIKEIIGRIADGSQFEEFKPLFGPTVVCGFISIHGYPVGVLGNNGMLFPDASQKAAHFIQLCNKRNLPLVFLQNITGFMIGKEYEQDGSIKKGSQLVNAVSNSDVPHLTVIVGNSYGAGTYAMSGREFGNSFTFLWPTAKIAVMGGEVIAGVMSLVRRGQAARKGLKFNEKADAEIVKNQQIGHDKGSVALKATSVLSDDGIIDPRDTREILGMCLSIVNNKEVKGSDGFGVFRL